MLSRTLFLAVLTVSLAHHVRADEFSDQIDQENTIAAKRKAAAEQRAAEERKKAEDAGREREANSYTVPDSLLEKMDSRSWHAAAWEQPDPKVKRRVSIKPKLQIVKGRLAKIYYRLDLVPHNNRLSVSCGTIWRTDPAKDYVYTITAIVIKTDDDEMKELRGPVPQKRAMLLDPIPTFPVWIEYNNDKSTRYASAVLYRLLKKQADGFDEKYYVEHNTDLNEYHRAHPYEHYICCGKREGRKPNGD
jgi:hypothetical protein